jgi:hypothetical protein
LHDAASRCEAVIFLVSANWLGSGWCTKEYALARGLNKKLFAALTDPTMTIGHPGQIRDLGDSFGSTQSTRGDARRTHLLPIQIWGIVPQIGGR